MNLPRFDLIQVPPEIPEALARLDAIRKAREQVWARTQPDNLTAAREAAITAALAGKPFPAKSVVEAEEDRKRALADQAVLTEAEERAANAVGSAVSVAAHDIFDALKVAHDAIIDRARVLAPDVHDVHPNLVYKTTDNVRQAWDEMLRLSSDWDRVRARAAFVSRRFLGNVQLDRDDRFTVWRSGFVFVMAGQGRRVTNPLPTDPVQKMVALANGDPWLPTPAERDAKVQALADALKQSHGQTVSY